MNRGRYKTKTRLGGYTIVEVLIFLAVSAALFASAILLINGRQNKVQFTNAVRDFESQLIDIANDVSNGYYRSTPNVRCDLSGPGGSPIVSPTGGNQGSNIQCIFLGRVIKLGDNTSKEQYTVYSLVGKRQTAAGNDVISMSDAITRIADNNSFIQTVQFGHGTEVVCVKVDNSSCDTAFGFVTRFNGSAAPDTSGSGIKADVFTYPLSLAANTSSTRTVLNNPLNAQRLTSDQTLTICLKSGTTKQYALLRLGGGSSLSITTEVKDYSGATPSCN